MQHKPWLKHYDEGVPASLEYPSISIHYLLMHQSQKYPNRIALIEDDKQITYSDLYYQAQGFSLSLIQKGLKPGDRVGICLPNGIKFVISFYGTLMAGGIVAAMNPNYPLPEWVSQATISKPSILIGLCKRENDLFELKRQCGCNCIILVEDSPDRASGLDLIEVEFDDLSLSKHWFPSTRPDTPAVIQFSGGTTGTPKAALASHHNVIANVIQFKTWLTTMRDGQEVFLTLIPLYHVYGMVIGLNVGVAMGATIILVPDARDLEKVLELVPKYGVTCLPGVPSLYHSINHHPQVLAGKINLRSIKACISGSAPLPLETRERFEALTGGKLVEGYGLSEAPTATHCNPIQGENRSGSIGLPLPDVDCRIVDLENDQLDLEQGQEGELLIRSPQLMREYYGAPEETALALKDGWLHTGDIGRMDKEGYFYLVGRKKELIKVNGLQVWPLEVEKVLLKFPGVKEAAAAGVPDEDSGETVKAWLVMEKEVNLDVQHLKEFCKGFLAGYKIPKSFELVASLPKSPVGKLLRRELQRLDREKMKPEA